MTTHESAIAEFIRVLEDHRIQCQKEGKYDEARIALQRLEDLKLHDEQRQKEALQKSQLEERLGAEEAHMLELQQLNLKWDKKMADYADHAHKLVQKMKDRHILELEEYQHQLLSKAQKLKFSPELLKLREVQERLAKGKDYVSAQETKERADKLEAAETETWLQKKQEWISRQETNWKNTKQQELAALKKRIQSHQEKQRKQRNVELERLVQRFQNVKTELDKQHNLERLRS